MISILGLHAFLETKNVYYHQPIRWSFSLYSKIAVIELPFAVEAGNGDTGMTSVRTLHKKWMKDGKYRNAYKPHDGEFELARAMI